LPHSSALLRAPHDLAPCWFVSLTDASNRLGSGASQVDTPTFVVYI
jgi:hypothetical protein